jgi:hypothetical protein
MIGFFSKRIFPVVAALALGALPAGAGLAPIDNLARYLPGNYRGATPGNELMIQINPVSLDPARPYDYFVSVFGKFNGTYIREQGVLRIDPQGGSIYLGYLPHFNPGVTSVSPNVARFSSDELNAACGVYLKIQGDGFGGETRPSDCARAIRGTAGRSWNIGIEPNRITLKDAKSGETLRFEKETPASKEK